MSLLVSSALDSSLNVLVLGEPSQPSSQGRGCTVMHCADISTSVTATFPSMAPSPEFVDEVLMLGVTTVKERHFTLVAPHGSIILNRIFNV